MRNIAPAIPLAIAVVGGTLIPNITRTSTTRFRMARRPAAHAAVSTRELLTEEQQDWLDEHNPFGIPKSKTPGNRTLIVRRGYTLAHNNIDLIADWVSFHLTREYVEGEEKRPGTSAFKPDSLLPEGRRAERADYKGWKGVYDRGHQCASADSKGRGKRVIRESFILSNITPQSSRLNQYKWRLLETKIQNLAGKLDELWVITGPAFVDGDGDGVVEYNVIGTNQVAVPTHYYKIVLAKLTDDPEKYRAMAFLIPNEPIELEHDEYLVSIDEIEEVTGLDFLQDLIDDQENTLESTIADEVWS